MRTAREEMTLLKARADRVCVLILSTDLPEVDILIERRKARELCEELFPDQAELFSMVYESRFDRLWQQFRRDRQETWPSK